MNKIPLMIILVALAAGCLGGGQVNSSSTRGLTINEFIATPQADVRAGEPVLFEAEVENIGGTTARNAVFEMFGVEGQWLDSTASPVDDTLSEDLGTLRPPDVSRNIPGQKKPYQKQLIAPNPGQGITHTYTVTGRVTYDYNTSGLIDMPALTEDTITQMQTRGEPIPNTVSVQNSAGPIQMVLETDAPIRVDSSDEGEDEQVWPMRIILTNVGDGFPVTEDDDEIRGGGKLSGTIALQGPGVEFDNCLGETGGTFIDIDSAEIALRIRRDNRAVIACSVNIDKSEWENRPLDSIKIVFNLFYTYYVQQPVNIVVTGRA